MLFKNSYRQVERYRLKNKLKASSQNGGHSIDSSPATSSEDGRGCHYVEFEQVKKIQDELDRLTSHINSLKANVAALAGSNGSQYEMSFKESIANAYDKERFELSEREFGQPFRK